MRNFLVAISLIFTVSVQANDVTSEPADTLIELVNHVNQIQNKVLMKGSTEDDVNALFDLYTEDFTYVHDVYGGTYSRDELLNNTLKFHKAGNYDFTQPRYKIVRTMPGFNAVAVERLQFDGEVHLAVFEFKGKKVSRILEYWK